MKVAVITCYKDPDYVRARTLRAALKLIPDVEIIEIKNSSAGFRRYFEVLKEVSAVKRQEKPDVFLLTFRGQEILPFVQILIGRTPLIFDEFIVPLSWATDEHRALTPKNLVMMTLSLLSKPLYKSWLWRCRVILADTKAHAELSSQLAQLPLNRYQVVPVSTDETVFKPIDYKAASAKEAFEVFFYGNMLPLHGLSHVLEAAEWLADDSRVHFTIIGGGERTLKAVQAATARGARIRFLPWLPFEKLSKEIAKSQLCLGGPFGNTPQANRVITGKTFQFIAMGLPTVVGKSKVTARFIDKENALVVPQADAEALAAAIRWAADHPKELTKIAHEGQALYQKYYSNKEVAKALVPALRTASADL